MDSDALQASDHPSKRVKLSPNRNASPSAMSNSMIDDDDDDLYDSPVKSRAVASHEASGRPPAGNQASGDSSTNLSNLPGLNVAAESSSRQDSTDAPSNREDVPMDVPRVTLPGLVEQEKKADTQDSELNASHLQEVSETSHTEEVKVDGEILEDNTKNTDAGFVEAAVANRSDPAAEWQYDSSNDETSDTSTDSSEDDSDDSGDDEFHKLNLEEQARILMRGEGGSDDEGGRPGKASAKSILRTANEKPDEIVKPDVIVTPDMEIQELGLVENIVESFVLIKGQVSGETRVLESGSVLCLEDRTVIGSVAEPIGRVDNPYYSVAFTDDASIKESGIEAGTRIFYVVSHSTYVFTQPLKAFKGSDASNQHDEEVAPDEIEFSDDEAEAEYKRSLKQEKLARRNANMNARSGPSAADDIVRKAPEHQYPSQAMNYDDGDAEEELYTPLARPDNFHVLSATDGSLRGRRDIHTSPHRGRGGGRQFDRGRGGKGGRGRPDNRPPRDGRGNRAGRGDTGARGKQRGHQSMQVRPSNPQNTESQTPTFPSSANTQMSSQFPGYPSNGPVMPQQQWPPPAYGGPGQTYGMPQSPVSPIPPFSPGGSIPPGSFVNPAFFRGQQPASPTSFNAQAYPPHSNMQGSAPLHGAQISPQQAGYSNAQAPHNSWGAHTEENRGRGSPGSEMAFQQAQEKLNLLRQLSHQSGAS